MFDSNGSRTICDGLSFKHCEKSPHKTQSTYNLYWTDCQCNDTDNRCIDTDFCDKLRSRGLRQVFLRRLHNPIYLWRVHFIRNTCDNMSRIVHASRHKTLESSSECEPKSELDDCISNNDNAVDTALESAVFHCSVRGTFRQRPGCPEILRGKRARGTCYTLLHNAGPD